MITSSYKRTISYWKKKNKLLIISISRFINQGHYLKLQIKKELFEITIKKDIIWNYNKKRHYLKLLVKLISPFYLNRTSLNNYAQENATVFVIVIATARARPLITSSLVLKSIRVSVASFMKSNF